MSNIFILESIRDLQKSLQLNQMVVGRLVPEEMLQLIEERCSWNEMIGEWQLKAEFEKTIYCIVIF